jgi:hypothetical protein
MDNLRKLRSANARNPTRNADLKHSFIVVPNYNTVITIAAYMCTGWKVVLFDDLDRLEFILPKPKLRAIDNRLEV